MNVIKNVFAVGGWAFAIIVIFSLACDGLTTASGTLVFLGAGVMIADIALLVWGTIYFLTKLKNFVEEQKNDEQNS